MFLYLAEQLRFVVVLDDLEAASTDTILAVPLIETTDVGTEDGVIHDAVLSEDITVRLGVRGAGHEVDKRLAVSTLLPHAPYASPQCLCCYRAWPLTPVTLVVHHYVRIPLLDGVGPLIHPPLAFSASL